MKLFTKTSALALMLACASATYAADAPLLQVDVAPNGDKIGEIVLTTIEGDHFNTFTTWYHLLDGKNFLVGATAANGGTEVRNVYDDSHLYCVVGTTLYNKQGGVATPVTGAVVNASGVTINGKTVEARFAQRFCPVKPSLGTITRTDGKTDNQWRSTWTSSYEPTVIFVGNANNMTTTGTTGNNNITNTGDFQLERGGVGSGASWNFNGTGGNIISDFTLLAKKHGTYAEDISTIITPIGGEAVTLTDEYQRITADGCDGEAKMASFFQTGKNGQGAEVTDVYVTLRRSYTHVNEREGYVIFPRTDVERRIPAIARVFEGEHAGRLVAVYDYRHDGGDIGGGNISLEISVSDDNGATWSTPAYLKDANGNAVTTFPAELNTNTGRWAEFQADNNQYWNAAFGDAALVADRESGKMLLMAVGGTVGFFGGRRDNPNQCVRWWSEDGGETWTPAENVTQQILELFDGEPAFGYIDSQFIGSGRIMQSRYIKVGEYYRIYAVISSQNDGGNTRNFMLYSDDFGQNWAVLGGVNQCPVESDGDECKAEELPDGTVVLAGRRRSGNRNFNLFRYTDVTNGQGKWVGHVVTDMGFGSINACDGEIMILPAVCNEDNTDCYLVLQSFPFGGGRNYVSIAYQGIKNGVKMIDANMFTSWEGRYRISDGPSVYSTMAWQANDKLAFFWENKETNGTYLDLSIEEITDGVYSYKPDAGNATALRLTRELMEERMKEDFASLEGNYVGQLLPGSAEAISRVGAEYMASPSYNTYVKFNKLVYNGATVPVVDNGGYVFTSGHDGAYSYTEPIYLGHNGTKLTADDAITETNVFTVEPTANGNYLLYNKSGNVYVGNLAATQTPIPVSADQTQAGEYRFIINGGGHTAISNLTPTNGSFPAIHLAREKAIVPWTNDAGASQWYMELAEEPEGYVAPEFEEPEYDTYDFDYENNCPASETDGIVELDGKLPEADEVYFDLQGRRIAKPTRGLYLTPSGRKVLIK